MEQLSHLNTEAVSQAVPLPPAGPAKTMRKPRVLIPRLKRRSHQPGPFERLLTPGEWRALPSAVRQRFFSGEIGLRPKVYTGRVITTELNRAGRILARLARVIGTPLPDTNGASGAASVTVAGDASCNGQIWTRLYAKRGRFPQVVHSVKRFQGPTGLEEFVGPGATWGIGMTLLLSAKDGALLFRSDRYFIQAGRFRMTVPRMLSPGQMTITHRQMSGGQFQFRLDLEHAWFGTLIQQDCVFHDCAIQEAK